MCLYLGICSFSWEDVVVHGVSSFRLLAVGAQQNLKLLEVEAERAASISLLSLCEFPAERLLEVIREQDHGEYHNQPTIAIFIFRFVSTNIIIVVM